MCSRMVRNGRVRGFEARDLCSGLRWHTPPLSSFRPTEEGGGTQMGYGQPVARELFKLSVA